uniref:Uncharacterized protein n=1 Tax=Rhizophora mucronata TaxID=61149 RepID=A0A2P2QTA2_RHIMU
MVNLKAFCLRKNLSVVVLFVQREYPLIRYLFHFLFSLVPLGMEWALAIQ